MSITRKIKFLVPLTGIGLMVIMAINFNCHTPESDKNETIEIYASLDSTNEYVGMQTCRECHQSIYDTYIETGMGKSMDVASKSKSSGNFKQHVPVYDKYHDFYYLPFWQNDSLLITEFRLDGKDTIYKRTETVSYIIGSGQHTNSHIMNTFGHLNQMPLTFYTQKGTWDLPPGFENGGNTRFNRLIGLECISCHNSYPEFILGSENRFDFIDNGINCERCHGPGGQHVKDKRAGKIVDVVTGIDYSIVNPAKLPIDKQLDVCQRCHIQGNAVLREGKSFFDFKPGMNLSDVMNVFMPVYKGRDNEHIMASHVERMKLSKCFTESVKKAESISDPGLRPYKNALTCVTCHNPHVSVKQTNEEQFIKACNSCHTQGKNHICTASPEKQSLQNNNCIACHMPKSGATDIPHVAVHDHRIGIPVDENSIQKIKVFAGINCINNPDVDNISTGMAYIAYFEKFNFGKEVLDSAKKYIPSANASDINKNFRHLIHIAFLEHNYNRIISIAESISGIEAKLRKQAFDNRYAWTSYRIGEAYSKQGNIEKSAEFYKLAYITAPSIHSFINKYATIMIQLNLLEEARKLLGRNIMDYPKYPMFHSNFGYLMLLMNNDTAMAREYYDYALALDPDYEQAILNKTALLMLRGKKQDATSLLLRYLKQNPDNEKVSALLKKVKEN